VHLSISCLKLVKVREMITCELRWERMSRSGIFDMLLRFDIGL